MMGGTKNLITATIKSFQKAGISFKFTPPQDDHESLKTFLDEISLVFRKTGREKHVLTRIITDTGMELRERVEELSLVRRMGETLDITRDVNSLYNNILEIILDEIGAENASIMILDKQQDELVLVLGRGKTRPTKTQRKLKLKSGVGVAGLVAQTRQPILIENTALDRRFVSLKGTATEAVSLLSLPFPTVGETIGVINVSHPIAGIFTQKHLRIMTILANQIAVAINNVRLVNQLLVSNQKLKKNEEALTQKVTELTMMNQVVERISFFNESIVENVQNGIFLVDYDGVLITWNRWLENNCAVDRKDVLGKKTDSIFLRHGDISLGKILTTSRSRKKGLDKRRFVSNCAGCSNVCEFSIIPVQTAGGKHLAIVVVNDISNRVAAEEERQNFIKRLENLNQQLRELDRAKSEFVSMVSHELRTPLTVLKGYLSLFEERRYGNISPQQQDKLNIMAQKVFDLTELIEELLDLSVIETGIIHLKRKELDLKALLGDTTRDFVSLGSKIEFIAPSKGVPKFCGDEERLKQVFNNLLENARKFSPPDKTISVIINLEDDHFIIQVKDQGVGVKGADKKKVFGKFYQSEKSKKLRGTGLGLAIVKEIVERHRGTIWVEDNKPHGTIFKIKLPLSPVTRKPRKKRKPTEIASTQLDYSGKQVLIIEDDPGTVDLLREILTRQQFTVEVAEDGIQALEKGLRQKYDLILLDLMLPLLSGHQVCRMLREEKVNQQTPIIIISAASQDKMLTGVESKKLNVAAYVSKPFMHHEFLEKIRQVLAKSERKKS